MALDDWEVSQRKLFKELREWWKTHPESPQEHYERLIRMGMINKEGKITTLLGGEADPEQEYFDNLKKAQGS